MITRSVVLAAAVMTSIAASSPAQPRAVTGTWDLTWHTHKGPERRGWLVLEQQGARLSGEIHGQGAIRAHGTVTGSTFELHGAKMLVPYTITGSVTGDQMQGSLKVLSVERRFAGARRR